MSLDWEERRLGAVTVRAAVRTEVSARRVGRRIVARAEKRPVVLLIEAGGRRLVCDPDGRPPGKEALAALREAGAIGRTG